jgi:hypothetical protein
VEFTLSHTVGACALYVVFDIAMAKGVVVWCFVINAQQHANCILSVYVCHAGSSTRPVGVAGFLLSLFGLR